jgi:hypothetical protein
MNSETRGAPFYKSALLCRSQPKPAPGPRSRFSPRKPNLYKNAVQKATVSPSPETAGHEVRCLKEWTILGFITVAAVASDQEVEFLHASLHGLCEVGLAIERYPGFDLSAQTIFTRLTGSPRSDVSPILYGLRYCIITDYL